MNMLKFNESAKNGRKQFNKKSGVKKLRRRGILKELSNLENYLTDAVHPQTRFQKASLGRSQAAVNREKRDQKRAMLKWHDPLQVEVQVNQTRRRQLKA